MEQLTEEILDYNGFEKMQQILEIVDLDGNGFDEIQLLYYWEYIDSNTGSSIEVDFKNSHIITISMYYEREQCYYCEDKVNYTVDQFQKLINSFGFDLKLNIPT